MNKYVLLKNESDLNEEQINKLYEGKNVSPILKEMHKLKMTNNLLINIRSPKKRKV